MPSEARFMGYSRSDIYRMQRENDVCRFALRKILMGEYPEKAPSQIRQAKKIAHDALVEVWAARDRDAERDAA